MTPTRDPREALVAWRASTGYSQTEVGALFGVGKSGVGQWESGRVRVPRRVQRRLRAEGWLVRQRPLWTVEHHAWLREHAGEWPLPELAARISTAFGITRSPNTVKTQAQRIGVSLHLGALLTREQIAYLCGVYPSTVSDWVAEGRLRLPPWARHGVKSDWAVPPAALEAFIAAHAIRLNPAQMPATPYRAQVQQYWTRERWLDLDQVAAHLGVHRTTVWLWRKAGQLPATLRPQRKGRAQWVIRARDLAAFLKQRESA